MGVFRALPPDYQTWTFTGGAAVARREVAAPVRAVLEAPATLYDWAARQEHDEFTGRGATYGIAFAGKRAVVRHARRGGAIAPLLGDRYFGQPRFVREVIMSARLLEDGVPTPAVLAGVAYDAGIGHRADVMTERVDGRDLAAIFYGDEEPPKGAPRTAILHAVGELVGKLYRAGFVHPDLQLRNILIAGADSTHPRAWLLDVDTVYRMAGPAARLKNLRRLYRSWDKWNERRGPRLTKADRESFSESFARVSRM